MAENQQKSEIAKREEATLAWWKERDIFKKSLRKKAPKGEFVFYEGPPTANGRPGIHHLESRAFKDAIPRFRTMQGYHVRRKAGWDTHGLPVELEVEKEIGSRSKKDIERFGIAEFNKKCKESVLRYIDEWKAFTDRIAFWVDHDDTYFTFDNAYIESIWHILKTAHGRKLLYKDYKVVPWCPRCGTALSSHEVAQGYAESKDPSVYVKFRRSGTQEYFLAWTTTPWTLPGNVALAVGKDVAYVKVQYGEEVLWLAKDRLAAVLEGATILDEMKGSKLVGEVYEPLFPHLKDSLPQGEQEKLPNAYKIYAADFVSTADGTGIVHTAVMYGADDFELGTKVGLPKHHLVNEDGTFSYDVPPFAGRFVKNADEGIIEYLRNSGRILRSGTTLHTYPFCWRCKTPLLYYARDSWYLAMSSIKRDLIAENEKIRWEPAHIKEGRFGEWLRELKDWAISRSRYWGTPLPIWECEKCKRFELIGSIGELREKMTQDVPDDLDLHRPYIDAYTMRCECGGTKKRVPEVLDVWFDSGAMPFAQDHYPFANSNILYPADYISEAIDQTRGWFYTLHAVGNLMGKGRAYKNVICLGHILDAKGKKMSKSLGNIVVPQTVIDKYGVDALRYFMFTVNAPGDSKNFDERIVDEIVKKNLGRLGNVLTFYQLYQNDTPRSAASPHVLDRWVIERLNQLIREVTHGFENYQLDSAARPITKFIDDLSVWYLRRSRDRFKDDTADKVHALATIRYVLYTLSLICAPSMPFFAEHLFQAVREKADEESVHLANWPAEARPSFLARLFGAEKKNHKLLSHMQSARDIVSQALEAREKAGIKVRQPLMTLTIPKSEIPEEVLFIIAEEVNVKNVHFGEKLELNTEITPELKEEGELRDLIRSIQVWRKEQGLKPGQPAVYPLPKESEELGKKYREQIEKQTSVTIT